MSATRSFPKKPSEEYLRKEAKRLARSQAVQLSAAQRRLAREYGYKTWSELIRHVKSLSAAFNATHRPGAAAGTSVPETRLALDRLLKRPVADLQLSMRAFTGLQHDDIRHIAELVRRSEQDLLAIRNFGRKSLDEVKIALGKLGLSLATRFEVQKDLPFLPLRELIAFPHTVYPVFVARSKSIKALKSAENRKIPIVMAAQKDPALESPGEADIYRIGVVGNLIKVADCLDGTLKALIEGKRRVQVTRLIEDGEFMEATTEDLTEPAVQGLDKLLDSVASAFVASRYKSLAANRSTFVTARSDASVIADRIASHLPIAIKQKQDLLETVRIDERLRKILAILNASK